VKKKGILQRLVIFNPNLNYNILIHRGKMKHERGQKPSIKDEGIYKVLSIEVEN